MHSRRIPLSAPGLLVPIALAGAHGSSMAQGVPLKGPLVGTKFPPEDDVAISIGHHELNAPWLDPSSVAIVDAFVKAAL